MKPISRLVTAAVAAGLLAQAAHGGTDRELKSSYSINSEAQNRSLKLMDRQITGLSIMPTAYSTSLAQRGITVDMSLTLVTGTLFGRQKTVDVGFAEPVLSQLFTLEGKYTLLREGAAWPSLAVGADFNFGANLRNEAPFDRYKVASQSNFLALSRTINRETKSSVSLGAYSSNQMKYLAYFTKFLEPDATAVWFAGYDHKSRRPSRGYRAEFMAATGKGNNAKLLNLYIKSFDAAPLTLFTYAFNDKGSAFALSLSFRLSFFPSLDREIRFKPRWWNPFSWHQNDNREMARRHALHADRLRDEGDHKEAVYYYQQALNLVPDNDRYHYNMAASQVQIEQYPEAIFHFNRAIEFGEADGGSLHALALTYYKAGKASWNKGTLADLDEARQYMEYARNLWKDVLKFDPAHPKAKKAIDAANESIKSIDEQAEREKKRQQEQSDANP